MSEKEINKKIGEAWKAHYKGQHAVAIEMFGKLKEQMPDNIDVLWGLGLSYRTSGDRDKALELFKRTQALVESEIEKNPREHGRLFMLNRMIQQQVDYISDFIE